MGMCRAAGLPAPGIGGIPQEEHGHTRDDGGNKHGHVKGTSLQAECHTTFVTANFGWFSSQALAWPGLTRNHGGGAPLWLSALTTAHVGAGRSALVARV